ncbi:MAG TPA: peptide ABC transporter substrate-binding protein [Acidimicrobiales bacterium]|nr:peptide ABC transporter substrate-binding protein [Acidimicrobiales bacterium]
MALSLVAAACGGDDDDDTTGGDDTTDTTEGAAGEPEPGGTLVLGAEQEPECVDWIASCAGASWGIWTLGAYTMPRVHDFDQESGELVPSPLMASAPTLEDDPDGGMTVTYEISDDAVWSDGEPITSTDFAYTWDQIKNGDDIYDKTGYELIESIDDSDPKVAVVEFGTDYAAWQDLFGGFYGVYPSHILEGQDRNAAMNDGYEWSGGPWKLEEWAKGSEIRLIPNENYWGQQPYLDRVVFRFVPDTAAEIEALKSGQVSAIYPQAQLELEELTNLAGHEFSVIDSLNYEALWFNTEKPPLDNLEVRKALAYATDRQAIVDALFKPVNPNIEPIQSFMTPANSKWYTEPFSVYSHDLDMVTEIMEADGWAKGSDGIWAKDGQRAATEINSTAGNARRERTAEILQQQWREAGFELTINFTAAGTLFGEWGPQGIMVIGLYAQVPPSTDPGICSTFCSKNIPTTDSPSGQNWTRLASDAIDEAWEAVETELDEDARLDLVRQGHQALADELPGLPVDPFPDIFVYNSDKLNGPLGHNVVYGPFWNMNEWWCTGGQC